MGTTKDATYLITGSGDIKTPVLESVITDLMEMHTAPTFYICWEGDSKARPSEGLRKVYDHFIDNELPFKLVTSAGNLPHPVIAKNASEILEDDDTESASMHNLSTDVLLLWDDKKQSKSEDLAIGFTDSRHRVFDLSNGMVPIVIESAPQQEKKTPKPVEDKIEPLTEEEIESMPKGVRNQFDRGVTDSDNTEEVEPPKESKLEEATVVYSVILSDLTVIHAHEKMSDAAALELLPEAF